MTLIKSISGIRGTIGGGAGDNLTPMDAVKFAAGYGTWLKKRHGDCTVVIGRDARPSGQMIENLVVSTLQGLGINVINTGLSTTPTVEMLVPRYNAQGGIILTASHNPKQWNALKLLNEKGEFVSGADGAEILALAESDEITFAEVDDLGTVTEDTDGLQWHIDQILALSSVDATLVAEKKFNVVIDLATKVRDGKITIDEMTGGTFTITNGGVFGSMLSTPIINPPQSAILGMHNIIQRPVAVDGEVVIRPMMYVALSYDHRVIDGRESVGTLVAIKEALENPEEILMGGDARKALGL